MCTYIPWYGPLRGRLNVCNVILSRSNLAGWPYGWSIFQERVTKGASMWFWSVSLADQLSIQFLIFFGQPKIVSETGQFFFVHSLEFLGASMWFWSVSLADQLSISHFFVGQMKIVSSQRLDNFLCPLSWIFCPVLFWKLHQFCQIAKYQKNEKLIGQLVGTPGLSGF